MKKAYLISNIEEYGKFIAYCIEHNIAVWRLYWDERQKGSRCYQVEWNEKRCYYATKAFYEDRGYEIVIPQFHCDEYGKYNVMSVKEAGRD